jgi:hypothetical protein
MSNFFLIVFCKIYGLVKEEFNALGLLTILLSLNIFTVSGYYKTLIQGSSHIMLATPYELIIILIVGTALYLTILKGEKYKIVYEKFKQDPTSSKKGSRITAIYLIGTLVLLTSLIWIARVNIK